MQHMTMEQRRVRDADFKQREQPRLVWSSNFEGTARRVVDAKGNVSYVRMVLPKPKSGTRKLTEAEDNARGRAIRRRQHRRAFNVGKPFCLER